MNMRTIVIKIFLVCSLLATTGCDEFKRVALEKATLQKLVETNAPLNIVVSVFNIQQDGIAKRGDDKWNKILSSTRGKRRLEKIDKSSVICIKPDNEIIKYMFFDANERITDFEIDAQ